VVNDNAWVEKYLKCSHSQMNLKAVKFMENRRILHVLYVFTEDGQSRKLQGYEKFKAIW